MSEDIGKLKIDEGRYGFKIGYWFAEDGDFGLHLDKSCLKMPDGSVVAACRAIMSLPPDLRPPNMDSFNEWVWESRKAATGALAVAKAAEKAFKDNKPLPAWASLALAAGWKPPKGWKP